MIQCVQNLIKFCPSILKILSKNQFLASIKGRNSVEHLRKKMLYKTNIDLVDDNVANPLQICKKMTLYDRNIDLVNDKVFTKFY